VIPALEPRSPSDLEAELRRAASLLPVDASERGRLLQLLRQRQGLTPPGAAQALGWTVAKLTALEMGRPFAFPTEDRMALLGLYGAGPLDVALGVSFASKAEPEARLRPVLDLAAEERESC